MMQSIKKLMFALIITLAAGCEASEHSPSYQEFLVDAEVKLEEIAGSNISMSKKAKVLSNLVNEADAITKRIGARQKDISCPPYKISAKLGALKQLALAIQKSGGLDEEVVVEALDSDIRDLKSEIARCVHSNIDAADAGPDAA